MTIAATTVWEVRTGGSQNNGGGFVSGGGGTDYSQQSADQYNAANLTVDGAVNTKVTSASHNFVAADVGNIMHITTSTGGWTAGWYQISSVAANAATLDRSPAAVGTGSGTYYVGGAFLIGGTLDDDWFDVLIGGNTVYISGNGAESTTFTLGESVSMVGVPTATNIVKFIGYKTTRDDECTALYRPTIACTASYILGFATFSRVMNLRFTGASSDVVQTGASCQFYNCYFNNTSGTAGREGLQTGSSCIVWGCEAESASGNGFNLAASNTMIACYAHDGVKGILLSGATCQIINCVTDTCATAGIDLNGRTGCVIFGNTIWSCTEAILGTSGTNNVILNNIIEDPNGGSKGVGFASGLFQSNYSDYNCYDTATDVTNIAKGPHDVTGDPGLNNPASKDFSIMASDSNVYQKGLDVGLLTSAITYS